MYELSEPKRTAKCIPPPGLHWRCSSWFLWGWCANCGVQSKVQVLEWQLSGRVSLPSSVQYICPPPPYPDMSETLSAQRDIHTIHYPTILVQLKHLLSSDLARSSGKPASTSWVTCFERCGHTVWWRLATCIESKKKENPQHTKWGQNLTHKHPQNPPYFCRAKMAR